MHDTPQMFGCSHAKISLSVQSIDAYMSLTMLVVLKAWEKGKVLVEGVYTAASDMYQVGRMLEDVTNKHHELRSSDTADLVQLLLSKGANVDQALGHAWLQAPVGG